MTPNLSIIIPTLNEEEYLSKTIDTILERAYRPGSVEVIVIDAGSTDKTESIAKQRNVHFVSRASFAGKKYESLNLGLALSKGENLLFLDADTIVPHHFDLLIQDSLKNESAIGGAFEFSFYSKDWKLYLLQGINRIRYRFGQVYYGDQGIFCKKHLAEKVGGFPKKELMESAFFCKELRKHGSLKLIKKPVETSPRRFIENGFFKVSWFDFTMWIRFIFNLSVDQYGKNYWQVNAKTNG